MVWLQATKIHEEPTGIQDGERCAVETVALPRKYMCPVLRCGRGYTAPVWSPLVGGSNAGGHSASVVISIYQVLS
jgi:hypothetical protein